MGAESCTIGSVDTGYDTQSTQQAIGDTTTGTTVGRIFTPSGSGTVKIAQISIYGRKMISGDVTYTIRVGSTTDLTSYLATDTAIQTGAQYSYAWINFDFSASPIEVTGSVDHYFGLQVGTNGDASYTYAVVAGTNTYLYSSAGGSWNLNQGNGANTFTYRVYLCQ